MSVDLHEFPLSPYCRVVKVLARKIGVDLNLIFVNVPEGGTRAEDYMKINPFHTVPTMVDDGFTMFESSAIMKYLASKYAPDSDIYPQELEQRTMVDAMVAFDGGSLSPLFVPRIKTLATTGQDVSEEKIEQCKDALSCLNNWLEEKSYVASDSLSIADIAIVQTLAVAEMVEDFSEYSNIASYYDKIKEELGDDYHEINDEPNNIFAELVKTAKGE